MKTVGLSEVGGLTAEVLARMSQKLVVLTSDKVIGAVVLPHTDNRQVACQAAKQYIALVNGADAYRVSRLKGRLLALLASHGQLLVLRRGSPVAVLLLPPNNMIHAERGARVYLEHLGIIIT